MNLRDIDNSGPVDIERLRKLAGISQGTGAKGKVSGDDSPLTHGASDKAAYMRKHKIEPGTEAWFKLWFARPQLSGENPYGEDTFGPTPSDSTR
jgi:hypothetical protein